MACPTPSPLPSSDKENQENQGDYVNSPPHLLSLHEVAEDAMHQPPSRKNFRKDQVTLWDRRFKELQAFKAEHGHCNVPRTYLPNTQLGTWINTQRKQYRILQLGESSQMTPARTAKLEELGFVWCLCEKQDWDVRFQELVEYKQKFGNCLVPQR